ncbi:hypothetical protein CAR_c24080 [Carnobacterium sp. 17-4]|uniref:DUF3427 domain-containing protein n=1 Tax=Carnobacterium sp. (strain 17-4) TaxID=208596 RepID=UPI000205854A|nr:DUF3427 domain-containing protein [Carnobacterium sp. 17-4]AEB31063.1 hypothetical protein CAR_c24080 [Carnobacterium sp. 17-4]
MIVIRYSIRVFAKKSDNEGTEFYYLGEVKPVKESIIELEKTTSKWRKEKSCRNVFEVFRTN